MNDLEREYHSKLSDYLSACEASKIERDRFWCAYIKAYRKFIHAKEEETQPLYHGRIEIDGSITNLKLSSPKRKWLFWKK